ncbi:MAG TPA: hypothetical protein VGO68_21990 [Pyrinomonadaceae bacterium]|jgi:hypothetical protein|nr:hypothetical protein [Pyrinomonadaceae bacterium]
MSDSLLSRIFSPTVLLYAFVVVTQIGRGIYIVLEGDAPAFFTFVTALGFVWIVGWWMRRDSQRRGIAWVYDMGMFLYILWPLIMPSYLLKSRGVRGLLVVLGFAIAYIGGLLVGGLTASLFVVSLE